MGTKFNILIAGVGGQGTLLASRVLGAYATLKNYDCKLSEVHGMAQRGGSVVTYVKFADKVYSPVISEGDADALIAFEQLEALRYSHNVKPDGIIIVNKQKIMPLPVITGTAGYPDNIIETLEKSTARFFAIDALAAATSSGNEKTVNTVMLGILAKVAKLDFDLMVTAIKNSVPEKLFDVNLKAFNSGYNLL